MKNLFTALLVSFCFLNVSAQTTESSVVVHKDPRIDLLVKKQIEINEITTRDNRRTAKGFRIQVLNTRDRNEAITTKTKLLQLFPDHKSYIQHNAPFFIIRTGNFKTRAEAEQLQRMMLRHFPNGVFIIPDTIEVNPDKSIDGDDVF
jgi:hypothetical protein